MIDPKRTILLVMDYQPAILKNIANQDELVERAVRAIKTTREAGACVGFVRVAFTDDDYDAVPSSNKGFSALKSIRRLPEADPESGIDPRVAPEPGDICVRKTRVGAFSTTDLADQLSHANIDTLILAGVATSGVVLSTVRYAADRDYRLFVLEDCCADADEEVHRVLLHKVLPRQAEIIDVETLRAVFA